MSLHDIPPGHYDGQQGGLGAKCGSYEMKIIRFSLP